MKNIHYSTPEPISPGKVKLSALLISVLLSSQAAADDFFFDPALLQGSSYGRDVDLSRFNTNESLLTPGRYTLDIYLNGQLIRGKEDVSLASVDGASGPVEPCLSQSLIELSGIRIPPQVEKDSANCLMVGKTGKDVRWEVDMAKLRLNLSVPQASLQHTARGYIPVSEWDSGAMALFVRHNTNFYHTENTRSNYNYDYLWSNINGGVNAGLWQIRHQGNLRYADNSIAGSDYKYNAVRTWVQRPIPVINSVLTLGDTYTNSSLFGSLSFNGMKLSTDERMWPQGKRGYAPEVRGVAATAARVVVSQLGRVVYETTVSPGAFVINDLYNTKSQGDLQVEVIEANGDRSAFTVPYSAVPDSVRPGNWNYELALGYVRNYYSIENKFFEGVLQHGVNNYLTTNVGTRLAQDYHAALLGGVFATPVGAFGLNTVYSHAKVENDQTEEGWRIEASYSKTFTTGTNLVLAAYRYSTSGYRDLQDVLGVRRQNEKRVVYYSDTLKQRNNFSATLSQPMNEWGMLNLTGSTADYYGNASRITQLQFGYSNTWRDINFNVNVARQRSVETGRFYDSVNDNDYHTSNRRKYTENTVSLGISVPLDFGNHRSRLSFDMNRSRNSQSAMTGISGSVGENGNFSYSAYAGAEHFKDSGSNALLGANVEQRTSLGSFSASASKGNDYRQYGAGISGTLLAHRGGVTAGPYTSETFALVHAPGAEGASVRNGQGAEIDRFGYALLPSLTPYRYNNVSLDSREMNEDVELQGGSKRVVPYAGAIPRINFETVSGRAILINTELSNKEFPPMGSEVMNAKGETVGMVGQSGQVYARLAEQSGILFVEWGKRNDQSCKVYYQLPGKSDASISRLTLPCRQE